MAYDPPQNDAVDFTLEDYSQPSNTEMDFTIGETAQAEEERQEPFTLPSEPLSLPTALRLPLSPTNLRSMNTGLAVLLVGLLGVLGGGAWILKNYVALALLGLGVMALLMSGTLGITLGLFWSILAATVLVLVAGAIWRMIEA